MRGSQLKHIIKTVETQEHGRPVKSKALCGKTVYEDNSVSAESDKVGIRLCKSCGGIYENSRAS